MYNRQYALQSKPACLINNTHCSPEQSLLYLVQLSNRAPAFAYEASLCDVDVEPVHGMIDTFDLPDFYRPYPNRS